MPFWALFLTAVLAGCVGALDGIGGGLILVPILTAAGVDIREAIAIGSVSVVAISNAASPSFLRQHLPNLKAVAVLEFFAIAGALIGALLTSVVSRHRLFLFSAVTLFISEFALWRTWNRKQNLVVPDRGSLLRDTMLVGSYYDFVEGKTVVYESQRLFLGTFCMFGVGILAGLLGGGGGIFTVLVAELVMGFPTKVALTMSNLMMGTIALGSLSVYLEKGSVHTQWMIPVVFGVLPGAFLGAKLLKQLKGQMVRGIFLCVLTLLGLQMFSNAMGRFR